MSDLLLVVTIGGHRAAIRAVEVGSVIALDTIAPVPRAPSHIAGLSVLRSRALTVIDCACSLELPPGPQSRKSGTCTVAAIEHDGHLYGLLVDTIDEVVEAVSVSADPQISPQAGWKRATLGIADTALGPLLLLDIAALIAGPPQEKAA
ncbi:hypothetical protein MB02_13840 [Croceicoccus estronivorus]|uniref:chemotaxis protein CheW n=1 Tax=Croceicoccus estronivorus TaxID=1172626 RepID=UPI00083294D8|nr:chemotaxis protein CheW [Croceicoccus estronivorus]OCC22857.1 hypothetical protein MB02_13840 [Croceicoccus estronivorus]